MPVPPVREPNHPIATCGYNMRASVAAPIATWFHTLGDGTQENDPYDPVHGILPDSSRSQRLVRLSIHLISRLDRGSCRRAGGAERVLLGQVVIDDVVSALLSGHGVMACGASISWAYSPRQVRELGRR